MVNRLLEMEKRFFKHSFISDREWLENALHRDFTECGKSGKLYGRQETLESLLLCKTDRRIDIYNFTADRVGEHIWIAHYITVDGGETKYYRTSVWIERNNSVQLYFHQASVLNVDIKLIKN